MERRIFCKASTAAAISAVLNPLGFFSGDKRTHLLSLSFDDGFKKSFYRIAEIHENYGLKACLNVIATGHLKSFHTEPKWIPQHLLGDFEDWNKFKARGHEVMPHTWEHLNLTELPVEKAKENITKCLDHFDQNLDGYTSRGAVYNFAYNASTTELDDFALGRVSAIRTGGWLVLNDTMANPIPVHDTHLKLGCWGHGPDYCDAYVEQSINQFLEGDGGWLILNLHGLDEEGWGPLRSEYLDRLLGRLVEIESLAIMPTGEVIKHFGKG